MVDQPTDRPTNITIPRATLLKISWQGDIVMRPDLTFLEDLNIKLSEVGGTHHTKLKLKFFFNHLALLLVVQ